MNRAMTTNPDDFAIFVPSWFDGEEYQPDAATFLIRDGRIMQIAAGDHSADLLRRDITVHRGGFLMPGLIDAHVHLFLNGAHINSKERSEHLKQPVEMLIKVARESARQSLACGVTLVRDAGDRHGINHRIRQEAAQPEGAMAQVRSGGLGVKRAKRYGTFMAMDVADAEAIVTSVTKLAIENDEIKLILTGIIDFEKGAVTDEPQFDLESTRLVVETARRCGRNTFAHCSGTKGLAIAVEAGVGSIEHGFFMTREILERMARDGIAWTPTFCPVHFQWAHPDALGWSPQTVGNLRRILDDHARHLSLAREVGVTLLLGTDAGSMGVEHGYALFDEIDRFRDAGVPLLDTLRAATSVARRHFGLENPLLQKNSIFEAVLLSESPFAKVQALRAPVKVWRG